jgi:hypothetical protein
MINQAACQHPKIRERVDAPNEIWPFDRLEWHPDSWRMPESGYPLDIQYYPRIAKIAEAGKMTLFAKEVYPQIKDLPRSQTKKAMA